MLMEPGQLRSSHGTTCHASMVGQAERSQSLSQAGRPLAFPKHVENLVTACYSSQLKKTTKQPAEK